MAPRQVTFPLVALLAACSGITPAPKAVAPPSEAEAAPTASNPALATESATAPVRSSTEPPEPSPAGPLGPRVSLPRTDAFLAAPLPFARPERYREFRELGRIFIGQSYLRHVDIFPDQGLLLTLSDEEARVRVYERATKRLTGSHAVPGMKPFATGGVVAWPEGEPRFLAGTAEGLVLMDALNGAVLQRLDVRQPLGALRWSPDERILLAADADGLTLHLYVRDAPADDTPEPLRLQPVAAIPFAERVDGFDLSGDNRLLAITHYPSNDLVVYDLAEGRELLRTPAPAHGAAVAFSPDGRFVAVGGQSLLLIDLLHPDHRAIYTHFYNNIGHVTFSPSGDALIASSYDGHLRIFRHEDVPGDPERRLRLSLAKSLRHAGQANVYGFVFAPGGDTLFAVSGDQTLRTFGRILSSSSALSGDPTRRTFLSLAQWRDQDSAPPLPPAPAPSLQGGHYVPSWLSGPARASRIGPGRYACKIDHMYKLRDCTVHRDAAGHTLLEFGPGNLLALRGVLYDDGPVVRFEGWLTEPSTVVGCPGCEKQPIHALFRRHGKNWHGLLTFQNYHHPRLTPEPPPADAKIEAANDRFPLVLQFRDPLPEPERIETPKPHIPTPPH